MKVVYSVCLSVNFSPTLSLFVRIYQMFVRYDKGFSLGHFWINHFTIMYLIYCKSLSSLVYQKLHFVSAHCTIRWRHGRPTNSQQMDTLSCINETSTARGGLSLQNVFLLPLCICALHLLQVCLTWLFPALVLLILGPLLTLKTCFGHVSNLNLPVTSPLIHPLVYSQPVNKRLSVRFLNKHTPPTRT